jgi:hypothetical protein
MMSSPWGWSPFGGMGMGMGMGMISLRASVCERERAREGTAQVFFLDDTVRFFFWTKLLRGGREGEGGKEGVRTANPDEKEKVHTHTHTHMTPPLMGCGWAGYGMGFRPIVPLSSVLLLGAVVAAWFVIASNRRR